MKKYTFLGLAILALIPTATHTVSSMSLSFIVTILPTFVGLLLIFFGTEKLKYENHFLRSTCSASAVLAVPYFIACLAQLYPYYLPYVFADESGGKRIFAALIKMCADLYNNAQYIFFGISSFYLAIVLLAFTSEMKHRTNTAKVSAEFSHKDAYGDKFYSQKAYSVYTVICSLFAVVFIVVGVLYFVNQFAGNILSVHWLNFDIRLEIILLPVGVVFLPFAYTAVEMISNKRREDRLRQKAEAEK